MCKLCTSSATITAVAIGRVAMFELPIPIMVMVIIRAIMVMGRASASASADIILREATGLEATDLEATAGVMDLEGTAADTTSDISLKPVLSQT